MTELMPKGLKFKVDNDTITLSRQEATKARPYENRNFLTRAAGCTVLIDGDTIVFDRPGRNSVQSIRNLLTDYYHLLEEQA